MFSRTHLLSIVTALAVLGVMRPAAAQNFKALVDKASLDLEKGACTDAQNGFSQAVSIASSAVGVAPPQEQIRVYLLLASAEVCLGDFRSASDRAARIAGTIAEFREFRAPVQFLTAEAAKGAGRYTEADRNYIDALRFADENFPENDMRRARYVTAWADLSRLRGQFPESETRLQQALSTLDKIASRDSIERAEVLVTAADLARDRDRWSEARTYYDQAIEIASAKGPEHPVAARAWLGRGLVEIAVRELTAAETDLKRAQAASRRLTASSNYLDVEDALGLLNLRRSQLKEAEDALLACLSDRRKSRGDQHPGTALTLDHLGLVYTRQQRWDAALDSLKKAESGLRSMLGPDHPELGRMLYHLGRVYRAQKKFEESASSLIEALKIEKAKLGAESLAVAFTVAEQGSLFLDQAKYVEAEQPFRQAEAIEQKLMPLTAPERLDALRGLALALHGQAKHTEAAPLLTQWMTSRGASLPLLEPERLPVAIALAEIELSEGKNAAAEKSFAEIASANEKLGKSALKLPLVQKNLGDALFAQKKYKDAARNYEAALPNLGDRPGTGDLWEKVGASYAAESQWPDSVRAYQNALDLAKKNRATQPALERLALVLTDVSWGAARPDQAYSYLREWMSIHAKRGDPLSLEEGRVAEKSASYFFMAKEYNKAEPLLQLLLQASDKAETQSALLNRILGQLADVKAAQNKNTEAVTLYQRLATRNRAARQLADSERYLLRARELREKEGGSENAGLVSILQDLGETYVAEVKYTDARTVFQKSQDILQKQGLAGDARIAVSLNGLGEVAQLGDKNYEEALKLYEQANELLKNSPNPPPRTKASVLYNIGSVQMINGKMKEASATFDQCLSLRQGNYTADNPPPIEQFDQIAGAFERQQRFDEAEKLYRNNLDFRRRFFGENSTEAAWGLYSLAMFLNSTKRYDEAIESGEKALHYFEGRAGEESDEVALVLQTLATIYSAKNDMDRSLEAMNRSVQIQQKLGRPRDEITPTLSTLGEVYRRRKDYEKALKVYQQLASLWQAESFGAPNYQRAVLYIAIQYAYLRDLPHGRDYYNKLQQYLQRQHDSIGQKKAAEQYAQALRDTGRERDARKIEDDAGITARGPGRD